MEHVALPMHKLLTPAVVLEAWQVALIPKPPHMPVGRPKEAKSTLVITPP